MLAIVGAVILAASIVAVVAGVALLGDSVDDFGDSASGTRSRLLADFELPGEAEVRLTPGRYYVYAIDPVDLDELDDPLVPDDLVVETTTSVLRDGGGDDGSGTGTGTTRTRRTLDLTATVTGPDGAEVPTDPPGAAAVFHGLGDELEVVREFRVTEAGTYVVAATGEDAPRAGVGRATDLGRAVGEALGGGLLTVVGGFGALLGGALLLAGLIWFLTSRSGPPAPPPASGYGYGAPPPGPWPPAGGSSGAPGTRGWAPPPPSGTPSRAPTAAPPPPADQPPWSPQGPVS